MPIGKNSIKRVADNGYSKVNSSAPDMENSTVIANPTPEVIEKMIPSSKKLAPKKEGASTGDNGDAPAKKSSKQTAEKNATKSIRTTKNINKNSQKVTKKEKNTPVVESNVVENSVDGASYICVGRELPIYLL